MKRLILQTYYHHEQNKADKKVGCYIPADELAIESEERFRIYADSIDADYKIITSPPFEKLPMPAWARFAILWETDYDEVCYIDADILPSHRALGVSIFDYPGTAKQTERDEGTRAAWHVNAGVFKLTRREMYKMRPYVFYKPFVRYVQMSGKNQDPFNEMYKKAMGRKPKFLSPIWNMTRPYHRKLEPAGGYFAHYIGHQKVGNGNQWGCMKKDPIYLEKEWMELGT